MKKRTRLLIVPIHLALLASCNAQQTPPETTDAIWQNYTEKSEQIAQADRDYISSELEQLGLKESLPAPKSRSWSFNANNTESWYSSDEAVHLIENVLSFQCPNGGWSKSIDFAEHGRQAGMNFASEEKWVATIDNQATISQIRLLAQSYRISGNKEQLAACKRGIEYLLDAQYPNGGWPQIYPLIGKYHDHITFNDKAMVNVLYLLYEVFNDTEMFPWVDQETKQRASLAFRKGIDCILDAQIVVGNARTAWCQQHDARTLEPRPARAYEMVSISSAESAEILDLLLTIENPDQRTLEAIESAISWLEQTAITGFAYERQNDGARALVPSEDNGRTWARFYEIGTNKPLFGDRDGSVFYELEKMSFERRRGYSWYSTKPESTLKRAAKWRQNRTSEN